MQPTHRLIRREIEEYKKATSNLNATCGEYKISTFIILRNGNYEKKMWLFNTKVEQPHSFDGSMLVDDLEQLYEEFPELIDSLDLETLGWRVYATQCWAE